MKSQARKCLMVQSGHKRKLLRPKNFSTHLLAMPLFCLPSFALGQNLLVNGSFENGNYAYGNKGDADAADLPTFSTDINGWTVTNTSDIAVIATGNRFNQIAEDGNVSLDITGYQDAKPYGGVQQTISTTPGTAYYLSFWIGVTNNDFGFGTAFNGPSTVTAQVNNTTYGICTNSLTADGQQWKQFTVPFTAASSTSVISLTGTASGGGGYIGLDNAQVVPAAPPSSIKENFSTASPINFTDYNLAAAGIHTNALQYRLVTNPGTTFTNGYTSYYDHTSNDSSGSMLFFDGSTDNTQGIWYQQVNLISGVTYNFSYWGSAADSGSVPVLSATVSTISLPGTLTTQNGIWSQYSTQFTVPSTGTYTIAIRDNTITEAGNDGALDDIILTSFALTVPSNTTVPINASSMPGISTVTYAGIAIDASGRLVVASAANHANRQLLLVTDPGLSIAGSAGSWTGQLDLTDNDMDLPGANLSTVTNQLAQGFNSGRWNGAGGILSSSAATDTTHLTALGVVQNNQGGSPIYGTNSGQSLFDNTAPGTSDILVKYTYYGDTNLDGKIDGSDYSRIDSGFLSQMTGWYNGDFNYDGAVNGTDYTLIDNAFNRQTASLNAQQAIVTSEIASGSTNAVPEPAALTILALGSLPLRRRPARAIYLPPPR